MASTFMRVAAASFQVKAADPIHNGQQVVKRIKEASERGAQVLLLPELCLSGGCCGALYEHQTLLSACIEALRTIISLSADLKVLCFVGLPVRLGGEVQSCMAAVQGGRLLALIPKKEAGGLADELGTIPIGDLLMRAGDVTARVRYGVDAPTGAGLMLHASSLAASHRSQDRIHSIFSASRNCAVVYASNAGDSTTDYVFDGTCAIYENGALLASGEGFHGALVVADIDTKVIDVPAAGPVLHIALPPIKSAHRRLSKTPWGLDAKGRILMLQSRALAKRAQDIGAKGFAVGVSGGLDSTIALIACAYAADLMGMSRKNVLGVMMPGFGSSDQTKGNAHRLIAALGVNSKVISIIPACKQHFEDIGLEQEIHNTTFENAQARERTQILMDIANETGYLNVGTGDLSESALGFTTFGGDHLSFFNVNGSLFKTQIREVLTNLAKKDKELGDVLKDILATPISPELLPTVKGEIVQRTEDIVGPYDLMDFYIYYLLRYALSCGQLLERARLAFPRYNKKLLVERLEVLIRRFFANQFKRNCSTEGSMVTELSLSPRAYMLPSDASASAWLQELKDLK